MKSLNLDPAPELLSAHPSEFCLAARMIVGPVDAEGEESFDVTVCTPEWLAVQCRRHGGIFDPRHHLVVDYDSFDKRAVHDWLAARVARVEAATWHQLAQRLSRIGLWEFEDYPP